MRSGVSFPSAASAANYTLVTGTAVANFPITNLSDLFDIREGAAITPTGGVVKFSFVMTPGAYVQFFALVHHNALSADTVRVILFSDTNPDPVGNAAHIVYDSTAVSLFPGGFDKSSIYPPTFPLVLTAPVSVLSGLVTFATAAATLSIGAIEIGGWWQWTDVAVGRSLGLKINDVVATQPFGVDHVMSMFNPRTISGTREMTDVAENLTTAVDFQLEKKTSKPFVWVQDIDDVTTYQREVVLVRNAALTPPSALQYPSGKQSFAFCEHLR